MNFTSKRLEKQEQEVKRTGGGCWLEMLRIPQSGSSMAQQPM